MYDIAVTDIVEIVIYIHIGSGKNGSLEDVKYYLWYLFNVYIWYRKFLSSIWTKWFRRPEFIGLEVNTSTTDNDISNFISNYNVSFPVCNDISPVA